MKRNNDENGVIGFKVNMFSHKQEKVNFTEGKKVVGMDDFKNKKNEYIKKKLKGNRFYYPPIMSSHSGSTNNTYYPKGVLDKVFPNKSPFNTPLEFMMYLNDYLYNDYRSFDENQSRDIHNLQLAYNNKRLLNTIIRKIGKDPETNIINEIVKGVSSSANVTVYVVPNDNIEFHPDDEDKRIKYTYYIYDLLVDGKLNPEFNTIEHAIIILNALMQNRLFLSKKQMQKSYNYKMMKQIMNKMYPGYTFEI